MDELALLRAKRVLDDAEVVTDEELLVEYKTENQRLRAALERIAYAKSTVLSDEQMEAVAQVFQRWAREALEHKAVSAESG